MRTTPLLQWEAPEYDHYERSREWFIIVGIFTIALAAVFVLLGNVLFAVFIVLGAATLGLLAVRAPRTVRYEINDRGLRINDTLYPFPTLESFGIDDEHEPLLVIKSRKLTMPFTIIPIHEDDVDEVRALLSHVLEEVAHTEPVSHKLMAFLGF